MIIHATRRPRLPRGGARRNADDRPVRRGVPERAVHERRQVHRCGELQPDGPPPPRHRRRRGGHRAVDRATSRTRRSAPLAQKYMSARHDVDGEYRTRLFHAIRDLTADAYGGWQPGHQHPGRRRAVRPAHRDPPALRPRRAPSSVRSRWPVWRRARASAPAEPGHAPPSRLTSPTPRRARAVSGVVSGAGCGRERRARRVRSGRWRPRGPWRHRPRAPRARGVHRPTPARWPPPRPPSAVPTGAARAGASGPRRVRFAASAIATCTSSTPAAATSTHGLRTSSTDASSDQHDQCEQAEAGVRLRPCGAHRGEHAEHERDRREEPAGRDRRGGERGGRAEHDQRSCDQLMAAIGVQREVQVVARVGDHRRTTLGAAARRCRSRSTASRLPGRPTSRRAPRPPARGGSRGGARAGGAATRARGTGRADPPRRRRAAACR